MVKSLKFNKWMFKPQTASKVQNVVIYPRHGMRIGIQNNWDL